MNRTDLRNRIKQDLFLLDGAMGTQLFARGIEPGKCNEYLNIESPEIISAIHSSYFDSGSDAVLTNTFGANKYALGRHGFSEMVDKINIAGAQIARKAAGNEKYVLGDIGPSGDFLEPLGLLKQDDLKIAFAQQAQALMAGGVDGFSIETMTALDEAVLAVEAVRSVSDLPLFVSMAFDTAGDDFKTMMGVSVQSAVSKLGAMDVDAVGFNCGTVSLDNYVKLAEKFVSTAKTLPRNVLIFAEPNAGLPELIDGKAQYKVTPQEFANAAKRIYSAGIKILGGCCGTTPRHIKAVSDFKSNFSR